MVDYRLSLVWGFRFFIAFVRVAHGRYRFSPVWGFPFFIAFVRVAHGRLQILTSVGLSVINRFCSRRMVDYRFLASVGSLRLAPITQNQDCSFS